MAMVCGIFGSSPGRGWAVGWAGEPRARTLMSLPGWAKLLLQDLLKVVPESPVPFCFEAMQLVLW